MRAMEIVLVMKNTARDASNLRNPVTLDVNKTIPKEWRNQCEKREIMTNTYINWKLQLFSGGRNY